MSEYIKKSQILIICHSMENYLDNMRINYLANYIITNANYNNIYVIGCKYDLRV